MKEIMIFKQEDRKTILILEDGIIQEKYEEYENRKRLEGNIYLGKVQNILPGMQAAFIDIGDNKNAFIHLKDLLPKEDEKNIDLNQKVSKDSIQKIIKIGMPILVQIKRDKTNKKGAKVSTHINLPGKYIVIMPNAEFITASQKIENEEEKQRLIQIVQKYLPKGNGAIIRTSAENKEENMIKKDMELMLKAWNKIQETKLKNSNPQLIYENNKIAKKIIMEEIDSKIGKIIVDDNEKFKDVKELLFQLNENVEIEVKTKQEILNMYCINHQLEKANERKIWLKCGGYITIDKTEALVAIDVNTGKYIGEKNLEETILNVNKEATVEITKQLRIRDIGGIIIIDYIDMLEESSKKAIIELLSSCLKRDRSKTQIEGFTKLNLFEMTRKHICSND